MLTIVLHQHKEAREYTDAHIPRKLKCTGPWSPHTFGPFFIHDYCSAFSVLTVAWLLFARFGRLDQAVIKSMILHRVLILPDPSHTPHFIFCGRTDYYHYYHDTRFIFIHGAGTGARGVQLCRLGTQIVKLNTMDGLYWWDGSSSGVDGTY